MVGCKLHRKIRNHWIWENSDRLKAWINILMEVNHAPVKVSIGNHVVECKRGQSVYSLHTWVKHFGDDWSVMKVRGFFKMLEDDGMITRERLSNTTRITICNYDSYQISEHSHNIPVTLQEYRQNTAEIPHFTFANQCAPSDLQSGGIRHKDLYSFIFGNCDIRGQKNGL